VSGPIWMFDLQKRDDAIGNFALDQATSPAGRAANITANEIADLLRAFFDAPTSTKLRVQPSLSGGIVNDAPARPLPPRDAP